MDVTLQVTAMGSAADNDRRLSAKMIAARAFPGINRWRCSNQANGIFLAKEQQRCAEPF
jgi:hypothetical protein